MEHMYLLICFEVGLDTQLGHWSNFKIEYTQDKDKDSDNSSDN